MSNIFGKPGNRTPEYINGSPGNDQIYPMGGWDIVDGGAGEDTVWVVGQSASFNLVFYRDVVYIDVVSGASAYADRVELRNVEWVHFSDRRVPLVVNRTLVAEPSEDWYEGGPGFDQLSYPSPRAAFQVERKGDLVFVDDLAGAGFGRDRLYSIERIHFSDGSIALDLDGNAGFVARLLGAVFAIRDYETSLAQRYLGIGLDYLERLKLDASRLTELAIGARLGPDASRLAVVELLYSNVAGRAPPPAERDYYVQLLDSGAHTIGSLGVLAAGVERIDLVGLAKTGLPYLPPSVP